MLLRRFCLAFAVLLGFGTFAAAAPLGTAEPLSTDSLAIVDYAKRGGKHGWRGGRGRHYGWHHGRRRRWHRGWHRRHYGWRRGHHHGWRRGPRFYVRF